MANTVGPGGKSGSDSSGSGSDTSTGTGTETGSGGGGTGSGGYTFQGESLRYTKNDGKALDLAQILTDVRNGAIGAALYLIFNPAIATLSTIQQFFDRFATDVALILDAWLSPSYFQTAFTGVETWLAARPPVLTIPLAFFVIALTLWTVEQIVVGGG
jgi:hypothetical protein